MALLPERRAATIAAILFHRFFAEEMVKHGYREYQAIADRLQNPKQVDQQTLEACIVACYRLSDRVPAQKLVKVPFSRVSLN